MYQNITLKELMNQDLPSLTEQRRMSYIATVKEAKAIYRVLNREIFSDRLIIPKIHIKHRLKNIWGQCEPIESPLRTGKSNCEITLAGKWFCRQWFIMTLAHEMCHQYEWDIISLRRIRQGIQPIMSHGPTFFRWRERLNKKGIPLRRCNDHDKWFATQRLIDC